MNNIKKHPQLESFIKSPSAAFICVKVTQYIIVNGFQDVTKLNIS